MQLFSILFLRTASKRQHPAIAGCGWSPIESGKRVNLFAANRRDRINLIRLSRIASARTGIWQFVGSMPGGVNRRTSWSVFRVWAFIPGSGAAAMAFGPELLGLGLVAVGELGFGDDSRGPQHPSRR